MSATMMDNMKLPTLIAVALIGALSLGWAVPFLDAPQFKSTGTA